MLSSLLKGVDFFEKSLKEGGKKQSCAVHKGSSLLLFPTKAGHFEILVQAKCIPKIWGGAGRAVFIVFSAISHVSTCCCHLLVVDTVQ
jgi:hypothetical protein